MREVVKYSAALLLYIGLTLVTKRHLNWISGPLFLVVLFEVIPRTFARLTNRGAR